MSFNKYFLYDKNNSNFIPVEFNPLERFIYSVCTWIIGAVLLCGFGTAALSNIVGDPSTVALKAENEQLMKQLKETKSTIQQYNEQLITLAKKDNELYRAVLGLNPISYDERAAGMGGADVYSEFDVYGKETADILKWTARQLEQMQYKIDIQKNSFARIKHFYKNNRKKFAFIPAIKPATGIVISGFGMRYHPILKYPAMHEGLDFSANMGDPIFATGKGTVEHAGRKGTYGNLVIIDHGYGYKTYYAHLSAFNEGIRPGATVERGQKIGLAGSTGRSTGPHLHYEVYKNGTPVNPIYYLIKDASPSEYLKIKRRAEQSTRSLD